MPQVVRLADACVGQITLPQHASASPTRHRIRHPVHLAIVYASRFTLTSHAPINEGADHYGESATPEQRSETYAENDGARHNRKQRSGIGPDAHFRHIALEHAMQPAAPARAKNACEPGATAGAGAPSKRKIVHKTAATPTMKKAVASQPCENLLEYTEYTAQAAAAAKVSAKGSGLDETSATTAPQSRLLLPPTASTTPVVATTAPGKARTREAREPESKAESRTSIVGQR